MAREWKWIKDSGCNVDDCDREHYGRGYCNMHFQRVRRHGDPEITKRIYGDDKARLDSYVEYIPFSGCHVWTGCVDDKGYGMMMVNKKGQKAHRVAWELYRSKIPKGKHVLHKCHTRPCVNPDHLHLGTHQENMEEMVREVERRRLAPSRRANGEC